jgi:hypothetical protein
MMITEKRYITQAYPSDWSPILDRNIDTKRMVLKISPIVLAPYSFLSSSPKHLRRYESERLTAVPKQIPRIMARIERIQNEVPSIGIKNTVVAKRMLHMRNESQRLVFMRIERNDPMIAPTAE